MKSSWRIVGHRRQIEQLESETRAGNTVHAYLFSGPMGIGKFRVAKKMAMFLQCEKEFCLQCDPCRQAEADRHPDIMMMRDNGDSIKINDIRELTRKTHLTHGAKHRVILMENIERMPVEAQNAFLKTLEEPPMGTIFIMTTGHIDRLLPTLQSRVRHYHFSTVADECLQAYLNEHFEEKDKVNEAVNMAQGRPGLAIKLMENVGEWDRHKKRYHQIEEFLGKNDLCAKFQWVESIEKNPEEAQAFFDAFTRYIRKILFDYQSSVHHPLKKRFSTAEIINLFDVLEKTRYFVECNVNKRLALENLLLLTEK